MNRKLLEHLAGVMEVDPAGLNDEELAEELAAEAHDSDRIVWLIEAASDFVDNPAVARIPVTASDIVYGILNELRDKLMYAPEKEVAAFEAAQEELGEDEPTEEWWEHVIDQFLKQFATREALLEWGQQFANSDVDEEHDVWSMDHLHAEEYADKRVDQILNPPKEERT